jgi:S1-C subfamily serine protease
VECHLIGDFQNLQREKDKTLDKMTHLYRSPDIKTIGVHLDVPKGLVVKEAKGAVAEAGMKAGDRITSVNGTPVVTFADLQHYYDKTDRRLAKTVAFTVDRASKSEALTVTLPPRWWWTDVRYRQSSVDPRIYFDSRALTEAEKKQRGLAADGFACEVTRLDSFGLMMKSHELKVGDVVVAVDGVERDPYAHTAELYMKLNLTPGDKVKLDVLRDGKRIQTVLTSYRLSFRK